MSKEEQRERDKLRHRAYRRTPRGKEATRLSHKYHKPRIPLSKEERHTRKLANQRRCYWLHHEKAIHYQRKYKKNRPDIRRKYKTELHIAHPEITCAQFTAYFYVPLMPYCEACDSEESLQRHHEDYFDPLNVITVCWSCHGALNRSKAKLSNFDKLSQLDKIR